MITIGKEGIPVNKKGLKIVIAILTILVLIMPTTTFPNRALTVNANVKDDKMETKVTGNRSYEEYLSKYDQDSRKIEKEIVINYNDLMDADQYEILQNYDGRKGISVISPEEGTMKWEFDVEQAGLYNIELEYYTYKGKGMNIERELRINGDVPFRSAQYLSFTRVWQNVEDIKEDSNGNEIKPFQVEIPTWQSEYFTDFLGYEKEPFQFYFKKGKNTIELASVQDSMLIRSLTLKQSKEVPTYSEILKEYEKKNYQKVELGEVIKIQAEHARYKSDPMLYPTYDRSSVATEPSHPTKIRLNTIGGESWKSVGQWLSWEVEVPESGLYEVGMKHWQNTKSGTYVARTLKVDGEIPFKEVDGIRYNYNTKWQVDELGDENPYLFYLEKGKHEITLEVSLGDLAGIIQIVESNLRTLNEAYREMLMIIGSTPDVFRDYNLEKRTPVAIEKIAEAEKSLKRVTAELTKQSAGKGVSSATLEALIRQLERMTKDPRKIPENWSSFETNLSSLGAWILDMQEGALQLDYLYLKSSNLGTPKSTAGFFKNTAYSTKSFIGSFTEDYSSVGSNKKESITVWVGNRDHGNILDALIKNHFIPDTGINVNVRIVNGATLLPATLAGQGPDVALGVGITDPVNYAIRNAIVDVSKFDDYKEVESRFAPSAVVPYQFDRGVYALPETQTFPMMFYRKDIFDDLGLEKPETWTDIYEIMPIIQKSHMNIGVPVNGVTGAGGVAGIEATLSSYAMFLYQNDGELYTENGEITALDSPEAIHAFQEWTSLYADYSIPVLYDFANRFRSGEMPIGIADYSTYNYLSVFAPELKGLWEMVPVPGTIKPDGSIDRSVASSGSATIMIKSSTKQEQAWEFMKWWTSAEIQASFGKELESFIGVAARYATANQDAVEMLGWSSAVYRNLNTQWDWVKGNPEVPGSYFTPRHIENAFRKVYNNLEDPRETMLDYTQIMDREITNKRKEFGLTTFEK